MQNDGDHDSDDGSSELALQGQVVVGAANVTGNGGAQIANATPAISGLTLSLTGPNAPVPVGSSASLQATLLCDGIR